MAAGLSQTLNPAPAAAPSPAAPADPVEALAKLKRMLDATLITADEFNAKKAEILGRM